VTSFIEIDAPPEYAAIRCPGCGDAACPRPNLECGREMPLRCSCGRFVKRGGRCSQEIRVYRGGTFLGWEHY
jgi:hypothetical protein